MTRLWSAIRLRLLVAAYIAFLAVAALWAWTKIALGNDVDDF